MEDVYNDLEEIEENIITKAKFKVGDTVLMPFVRSHHLDPQKGIGWYVNNVKVKVDRINESTFCFWFNNEYHFYGIEEAKIIKDNSISLFSEEEKIIYTKDTFAYRYSIFY